MDTIKHVTEKDDPNRCQHIGGRGQCTMLSIPGKNKCHAHNREWSSVTTRNYRLTKWQAELERMGDNPGLKTLRDELAILRMLMEERLNLCKDAHDLLLQSHTISDLATKIERVVLSATKLDHQLGRTLDKSAILNFANEVISILGEEIQDSAVLERIATKITGSLTIQEERICSKE